jgi:Rod binding domain-containing protein
MDNTVQSYTDMAAMTAPVPQMSTASMAAKLHGGANIDKSAQDFEAMFMTQMLQPMFQGLGTDPTFGGGHGEEIMRTFLLQEYGKIIAKSGKIGIAAAVKDEMIKAQANTSKVTSGKGNAYAAVQ